MIVVLGRPALVPPAPGVPDSPRGRPGGLAAAVALAARAAGAEVQLVGTIGDDTEGDALAVELARQGVGHAALLRDPGARTPIVGADRGPLPRLDAKDVELGLRYLGSIAVVVVTEPLPAEAEQAIVEAAGYHGAAILVLGDEAGAEVFPAGEAQVFLAADPVSPAFVDTIARYAAALDRGEEPGPAFEQARIATGWDPAGDA